MSRRRSRRSPQKPSSEPLDFLRRWRRVLRLPLNAKESRWVEGTLAPDSRGALEHLLNKVDRSAIEAALQRQPLVDDAVQRARFLAGAAAITGDAGVLIDALEAQAVVANRADISRTFAKAIRTLDLSRLSHARLARVLVLVEEVFAPAEQLSTAFALLRSAGFRRALEKAAGRLPPNTANHWLPLVAVHEALDGEEPAPDVLEQGLRILLEAPPEVLDRQPTRIRFGLVTAALGLDAAWPLRSAAIGRIVEGLDRGDMAWAGLAFSRAAGQVRLGRYDEASALLDQVLEAHPGDLRASALLTWLCQPRTGPLALTDPSPGGLRSAYALSQLRPVWVRTDADSESIAIHRDLVLPGIATPLLSDVQTAAPWFAVDGTLPQLSTVAAGLDHDGALQIATAGVRIAALLGRLGLTLPDLDPTRFLVDQSASRRWLLLADLTGARRQPAIADAHMRTVAARFARAALADPCFTAGPVRHDLRQLVAARLDRHLAEPPAPDELATWLEGL